MALRLMSTCVRSATTHFYIVSLLISIFITEENWVSYLQYNTSSRVCMYTCIHGCISIHVFAIFSLAYKLKVAQRVSIPVYRYSVVEYLGIEVLGAGLGFVGDGNSNTICSFRVSSFVNFKFVADLYSSRPRAIITSRT